MLCFENIVPKPSKLLSKYKTAMYVDKFSEFSANLRNHKILRIKTHTNEIKPTTSYKNKIKKSIKKCGFPSNILLNPSKLLSKPKTCIKKPLNIHELTKTPKFPEIQKCPATKPTRNIKIFRKPQSRLQGYRYSAAIVTKVGRSRRHENRKASLRHLI